MILRWLNVLVCAFFLIFRILSCSHVWQASSLISSLWIATPRGRCLGIHRLTTQRQWRMMHLPIGLVRVSRHAPGHRQQVCGSFGDTPADQGGTAMDQANILAEIAVTKMAEKMKG
jgi:hypothetical protein